MAYFTLEHQPFRTNFRVSHPMPGVKDCFITTGMTAFPGIPACDPDVLARPVQLSKLTGARKRFIDERLSLGDTIALISEGTLHLPDRTMTLQQLKLEAPELLCVLAIEATFAAVAQVQALPPIERPILGIEPLEWQALVTIQHFWNKEK